MPYGVNAATHCYLFRNDLPLIRLFNDGFRVVLGGWRAYLTGTGFAGGSHACNRIQRPPFAAAFADGGGWRRVGRRNVRAVGVLRYHRLFRNGPRGLAGVLLRQVERL